MIKIAPVHQLPFARRLFEGIHSRGCFRRRIIFGARNPRRQPSFVGQEDRNRPYPQHPFGPRSDPVSKSTNANSSTWPASGINRRRDFSGLPNLGLQKVIDIMADLPRPNLTDPPYAKSRHQLQASQPLNTILGSIRRSRICGFCVTLRRILRVVLVRGKLPAIANTMGKVLVVH